MFKLKERALLLSALVICMSLAACISAVGQQSSQIDNAPAWTTLSNRQTKLADNQVVIPGANAEVDQKWWRHFGDPTLDYLIDEAIKHNKDLKIAKARVEEARAARTFGRSALAPQLNAEASGQRGNQGYITNGNTITIGQVDIAASWELDLFGRNQARAAEAAAILQSTEASQHAVRVALLAEVARTYFDMRDDERQLELTRRNLETQRKTLELIRVLFEGAKVSNFDVQRAAAQVSATESRIPALQVSYDKAVNRLGSLLGRPPGTLGEILSAQQPSNPVDSSIVVAAPANVLATRPDVRVAERKFAATISGRKAAVAELFPNISLTAFFGAQSASPLSTTPWGVGIGLVQPILNFGRISSQIDAADSRQRQAFLSYQQTVIDALEDMENALSSYINESVRNSSLSASVQQNRTAADLARERFSAGYIGLLDVLVAERDLLDAESQRATSDANLHEDLVAIYTAAGGGWRDE
jgi:NodT family efflux transporter outer membrane factor (OMF) lipoprotein